jgi:hypothetical protein
MRKEPTAAEKMIGGFAPKLVEQAHHAPFHGVHQHRQ